MSEENAPATVCPACGQSHEYTTDELAGIEVVGCSLIPDGYIVLIATTP